MLVSDLLEMDIPAQQLLQITGIGGTKRTICKARQGQIAALERIGLSQKVDLTVEQLTALEKAIQARAQVAARREAEKAYDAGLVAYAQATDVEESMYADLAHSYAVYAKCTVDYEVLKENFDKLTDPSPDAVRAISNIHDTYGRVCSTSQLCVVSYKQAVNTTKDLRASLLRLQSYLKRKLPSKLVAADKRATNMRKDAFRMIGVLDAKPRNTEEVNQAVS